MVGGAHPTGSVPITPQRQDNRYKACTDYPAASGYSAQGLYRLSDNLRMFGTRLVPLILLPPDILHKVCTDYPATSGCSAQALCRLSGHLRMFGTRSVPIIRQPQDVRHKTCTAYPATSGCSAQGSYRLSGNGRRRSTAPGLSFRAIHHRAWTSPIVRSVCTRHLMGLSSFKIPASTASPGLRPRRGIPRSSSSARPRAVPRPASGRARGDGPW